MNQFYYKIVNCMIYIFIVPFGPRFVFSTSCSPFAALMFIWSAWAALATSALGFTTLMADMSFSFLHSIRLPKKQKFLVLFAAPSISRHVLKPTSHSAKASPSQRAEQLVILSSFAQLNFRLHWATGCVNIEKDICLIEFYILLSLATSQTPHNFRK